MNIFTSFAIILFFNEFYRVCDLWASRLGSSRLWCAHSV